MTIEITAYHKSQLETSFFKKYNFFEEYQSQRWWLISAFMVTLEEMFD